MIKGGKLLFSLCKLNDRHIKGCRVLYNAIQLSTESADTHAYTYIHTQRVSQGNTAEKASEREKERERGPQYLPIQSPLSKCLFWTRLVANWLQLTLYRDELVSEHETFPFGREKEGKATHILQAQTRKHTCK